MRSRKITVWIISVAMFASAGTLCFAAEDGTDFHPSPERLFARGNDLYEEGNYAEAVKEYSLILAEGYESGSVYYNLGDAYFKLGDIGKAILNYERAKRLIPRDADLEANYKFARSLTKTNIIPGRGISNWRPLKKYYDNFTVDELLLVSSGAYIVFMIILFTGILRPGRNRYRVIASLMVLVFIILNSTIVWYKIDNVRSEAVTVVPEEEALYGPFESATKFFTLYEGMKIKVLTTKDNWVKIKRADGKVGWVDKGAIEKV